MKKFLTLFILTMSIACFGQEVKKSDLVGKWSGEDKGEFGSMTFDKDGYATIEVNGRTMGGKSFNMNGIEAKITYTYDFSNTPLKIDVVVSTTDDKVMRTMYFIAEFIDQNTMKLGASMGSDNLRPKEFTEDNSIVLKREE